VTQRVDSTRIDALKSLFLKWNARINLSAARTPNELDEHVRDSLAVVSRIEGTSRALDVGSGGGFPLLVVAIARPDISFVGLEPVHKKHAFLRTAIRELGLDNVDVRAERLEVHTVHDYDVAMSRATFDLAEWLARGREHVRPGGCVIGFEAVERALPFEVERHRYELDGKPRALVILRRDS
jgi:16S rRNA (guanine527-N7)-methyltransferase